MNPSSVTQRPGGGGGGEHHFHAEDLDGCLPGGEPWDLGRAGAPPGGPRVASAGPGDLLAQLRGVGGVAHVHGLHPQDLSGAAPPVISTAPEQSQICGSRLLQVLLENSSLATIQNPGCVGLHTEFLCRISPELLIL